ncbi:hypothetical protein HBI56_165680 [Parastagonospora nodorum]|uniref:Uncharacterized protein n=1 Tax=Phaeosphaeria nodorum (strain SN15 / ATCC MYA-4574 / FGSC 10173) TaxID=321614 RepID=A0A7U2NQF8_PHANO|nr:hypothetical protein HBH56_073430 [Parastagonospora nodorum]QRD06692.1 hypothetical protein JI435_423550 [Parastagonospora nodorum SN15]KAH3927225.1 hypothetical protein HBH54_153670 [Parastagonospora nodorum]KAH3981704.1 hypothetical protein HBH51_040430 [Parastagonospora nodorum]KAH3983230.1 hypothetical protein HBH52_068020 [Parastagonospora nodorum]
MPCPEMYYTRPVVQLLQSDHLVMAGRFARPALLMLVSPKASDATDMCWQWFHRGLDLPSFHFPRHTTAHHGSHNLPDLSAAVNPQSRSSWKIDSRYVLSAAIRHNLQSRELETTSLSPFD